MSMMGERKPNEMAERELAQEELAEYKRLAANHPDAPGINASDLAAIGAARSKPGITRDQVTKLVRTAHDHGRTWSEIADRLGMTPEQALRTYGTEAETKRDVGRKSKAGSLKSVVSTLLYTLADALQRGAKALNHAASATRDHSRH